MQQSLYKLFMILLFILNYCSLSKGIKNHHFRVKWKANEAVILPAKFITNILLTDDFIFCPAISFQILLQVTSGPDGQAEVTQVDEVLLFVRFILLRVVWLIARNHASLFHVFFIFFVDHLLCFCIYLFFYFICSTLGPTYCLRSVI